jgi:hypothetical protein
MAMHEAEASRYATDRFPDHGDFAR